MIRPTIEASTVVFALLWLWAAIERRAGDALSSASANLVFGATTVALVVVGTVAAARLCRAFKVSHILAMVGVLWTTTVVASTLIHRSAETTIADTVLAFLTFGLLPDPFLVAGLDGALALFPVIIFSALSSFYGRVHSRRGTPRNAALSGLRVFASPVSAHTTKRSISLAVTAGLVAFGPTVFDLLARQHVERAVIDSSNGSVVGFTGPLLPTVLWTIVSAGLLGILVLLPMLLAADHLRGAGRYRTRVENSFGVAIIHARARLMSIWVVALAFWIRIATLLTVAPTRTDGGDPLFYHVTANLLAQGRGLPEPLNFIAFQRWIPSALHGPAYPIVLSISSRLGGTTYFDHKILSILIGTAVVAGAMLVANLIAPRHLRVPSVLITGVFAAVYPNLWLVDSVLFPEGLMALLTLGVVYGAYSWWQAPSIRWALALGALIAASALTRGEGLLLSVLIVLPLTLSARQLPFRRRLLHLVAAGLACLVVIAPWSIRNARSFEVFVPLSTNGNELFVYANCPPVYEGKFLGFWLFQCQEDLRAESGEPDGDEAEKSLYWREIGLQYARDNAEDLPRVLAARIGRQWELFRPWQNTEFAPIEGRNKDAARIGLFMYYGMIPAALAGTLILRRHRTRLLPIAAVFASVTLTAAYAYGTTRFRVPAEPLLCILAAIGSAKAFTRIRMRWPATKENVRFNMFGADSSSRSFVQGSDVVWREAFRRTSLNTWSSFAIVGFAIAVTLPALYRSVGSSMEEGFMLVFPELVMQRFVPNVDFLHLYGPGSLHALALWFEIFDVSLISERTFGLLQHLAFITGLMTLVRPWGRSTSTLVGLGSLLFVLTPIGLQALAWSGALGLGIWSLVLLLRARHRQTIATWAAAGVLGGLALTFRPDLVLALALPTVVLLWRQSKSSLSTFVVGTTVGLGSFWWHLVQAGPRAVFEGMFLDPVVHLRAGRELPRPPSPDRLDGALQVISEKFAPWWGFPHLSAPKQLFVWFFLIPLIALSIVFVAKSMSTYRTERRVLLASGLFGIGLLPQAIQRPDSAHFLWVCAVSWPLVIVAGLEFLRRHRPRLHPRIHLLFGASILGVLVLIVVPFYTVRTYTDLAVRSVLGQTDVREVRRGDRFFYLGDERPFRATLEVVADLDVLARPGQTLFVGPVDLRQTAYSDVFFYHLFPELKPSTYFIEMDPGMANEDPRLAEDVASSDWLILTRFWSGWIEPNTSIHFGSDRPNQIVEESFCLVESYQNDLVRLFRRCPAGDGIGPYEGPYKPEYDYAVEVLVPVPPRPDGTCTPTCNGRPSATGVEIGIDTSVID